MNCLSKIDHYIIPNDLVVILGKIYRFIGNNDFYINSLGNDLDRVIDKTVEKDTYFLGKILRLDITEARMKLIITKNSTPRNKEETTLANIKVILSSIQHKYQVLGLQSNDLFNIINYVYSNYSGIKFDFYDDSSRSFLSSQSNKSKRLILDNMNEYITLYLRKESYDNIILYLHYFIDLYNLKPFTQKNEVISLIILYQLVLTANLNAFKYVSFFEKLYYNFEEFTVELSKASVNWKEGYSQTTEFVRYFLNLVKDAYSETDLLIKNYQYDKTNKKYENVENMILSMKSLFTKQDIRKLYPYVSESTINRTLASLKDEGYIEPLGKGRSAKWIRKK